MSSRISAALLVAFAGVVLYDVIPHSDTPIAETSDGFAPSYFHARQAFRVAAAAAGAETEVLSVHTDPATGLEYTIDVATFPASSAAGKDAPLLVHMSGVHGVEGFAGSAVQVTALRERAAARAAAGNAPPLDSFTTCFVHAVNPVGFATLRRFNENNVDLNRNNLSPAEWEVALARAPNFARYADFDSMFNPLGVPQWHARFSMLAQAAANLAQHGFGALKRAIVTGQYHKKTGAYFGGSGERESSLKVLRGFVERRFNNQQADEADDAKPDAKTDASGGGSGKKQMMKKEGSSRRVVVLDVHTGLGPPGKDSMLVDTEDERARAASFLTTAYSVESPFSAGAGANAGYEDAMGTGCLKGAFAEKDDVLFVTQEFGTQPGVLVARALIIENQAYHAAPGSSQHDAAKQLLKEAFYVPTKAWRAAIVTRGLAALAQTAEYLGA